MQTLGEGEGSLTVTRPGELKNAICTEREIAARVFLAGTKGRITVLKERIYFSFKKGKFTIVMSANGRIAELILRFQVWVQLKQNVKETAEPHD